MSSFLGADKHMDLDRIRLPLIILGAAAALLSGSLLIANWYSWEPSSFPIDLRAGIHSQSPSFRTDLTTTYLIELEVERNIPFEELNCLLGVDPGLPDNCRATPSPVDIKWSVFSTGKLVAKGVSKDQHDGAWGATISRTIGSFQGNKGYEYLVQIESVKDASILAPAKPHITIRVHPIESKGHFVFAQLLVWVASIVAIVGLLWLLKATVWN